MEICNSIAIDKFDKEIIEEMAEVIGEYILLLETSDDNFGRDIEKLGDFHNKAIDMVNKINIKGITDYIIKTVQENSILSGFQYIVSYTDIEKTFDINISNIKNDIIDTLSTREEVADVQVDEEGFDVVLYTKYAPNYNEEDYE